MKKYNANKMDHRVLGEQLKLFKFSDYAPGIPFFLPKGVFLYQQLQDLIRRYYRKYHYQEIMSPLMMSSELWKRSGHYNYFKENMFFVEEESYALKPMNCPAHMILFQEMNPQKHDLPLRIADFGKLFRNENSGSLHGLARVKSFSQDDAHIFLAEEQLAEELAQLIQMVMEIYQCFGFKDYRINFSSRPAQRAGSDADWDRAESILRSVLAPYAYQENPGDGAFYGPKIDFEVADSWGRYFQLGSIQLDFQLPERFKLAYQDGPRQRQPIVIHRAILGSLERFIAILLENSAGWLPPELAMVQAKVLVLDRSINIQPYEAEFKRMQLRYQIEYPDNIKAGVKSFYQEKPPFLFIIGEKEQAHGDLVVKSRAGESRVDLAQFYHWWQQQLQFKV